MYFSISNSYAGTCWGLFEHFLSPSPRRVNMNGCLLRQGADADTVPLLSPVYYIWLSEASAACRCSRVCCWRARLLHFGRSAGGVFLRCLGCTIFILIKHALPNELNFRWEKKPHSMPLYFPAPECNICEALSNRLISYLDQEFLMFVIYFCVISLQMYFQFFKSNISDKILRVREFF